MSAIVRVLRIASFVTCLIVAMSFTIFAVQQTKAASGHQTEAVNSSSGVGAGTPVRAVSTKKGTLHKAIDEASEELTSPFSGIVSSISSEWASQGVRLLLALVVYGFGLGYVARVLRVRV